MSNMTDIICMQGKFIFKNFHWHFVILLTIL